MITTIENLFSVDYGQKEFETKGDIEKGNTILIASGGEDNGVYGFLNITSFYKAPFITVPRTGTIGMAFVQTYDCCVNNDVMVLLPKTKLSLEELYQVAYQIRLTKWKYAYGRKITPKRLNKEKIKIEKSDINYNEYVKNLMPKEPKKVKIQENRKIKLVQLINLCRIERRNALPENQLETGNVPYVTTSSKNNGVSEFVNEKPNSKGKCITVALNGSVGEVFFQTDDFITGGDNAILTLSNGYNPYLLLYIGYQIHNQKWGFNYYRKLSEERLKKFMIPVPINEKGDYDLEYIEKIIKNCYGYNELKKYL
jgi:hypothetical protein